VTQPSILPSILIVETDVLIRHPLAEYLRECGFRVLEATSATEARQMLEDSRLSIDVVLADMDASGDGFALAAWIRGSHPAVRVILAGSHARAAESAGDLCEDGPMAAKPYDHQLLLAEIRRLLAARDRTEGRD
jgi:DNA-binding response OmpR family regulator